ncbi:MAG TPA: DHH family phosphoesterase [Cytophagales bacterium]|jgi:phosphoesterase RecJ-like protein|nr:DHH family phosphoesterase [Cytophagales bacterium]
MQNLQLFKELLSSPKKIVITTHHKPDADALGSSLGLAGYLKKKGHQVSVITPSDYPDFLAWMKGNEEVINFENGENKDKSAELVSGADMIFCLDFNNLSRINGLGKMVEEAKSIKVLIDHHQEPQHFADFEYWSADAAATCELVFDLIVDLGESYLIDGDLANALYAGIMTDTGQFKHPNTTKNVHLVTAQLIDLGADTAMVGKLIYDNNSLNRLKFTGFALSQRLKVLEKYRTAYIALSAKDLSEYQSRTGDTEGLVNMALSLKGIVFAALITEREDGVKLSLRSKGDFSVSAFAKENFNGGGHANASGASSDDNFEDTVKKFEALLPRYEAALNDNHQKEVLQQT